MAVSTKDRLLIYRLIVLALALVTVCSCEPTRAVAPGQKVARAPSCSCESGKKRKTATLALSASPSPVTPTRTATGSRIPTRGVNAARTAATTDAPSSTPRQTPTQEVWIAARSDGLTGSGIAADPYDGSTSAKFDALMNSFHGIRSLGIHLVGSGPFRTDVRHSWVIGHGWNLTGDEMYATTLQLVGNASGMRQVTCLSSNPDISTDDVVISDLTVDCNWAALSATADTGIGGEKNIKVASICLWGNNNLIKRVRSINTYGSRANGQEHFAIGLGGPRSGNGTNNIIQSCSAELPQGNYGNPFSLGGWPPHLITNSKVLSSTAIGVNDGLDNGFTSGGVNLAFIKNCEISGNTFIDCQGAAYQDTGSCDGLEVRNNVVIRGCIAVGLWSSVNPKQNIEIIDNDFQIQNRYAGGASYGIFIQNGVSTNVTVSANTITFDSSGCGQLVFRGILIRSLNNADISNNTIGFANCPVDNAVTGAGVILSNNQDPNRDPVPGL